MTSGGAARSWLRPRTRRVDLLVAVLLAALGFGTAVQVRSARVEGVLAAARPEDLVQILDDVSTRNDRLREEIGSLRMARDRLGGQQGDEAARAEAERRTQVLGVLAGSAPARGPGIVLTIADPDGAVRADSLLDALEELRDAGAEAVQLEGPGASSGAGSSGAGASGAGPVRVVAATSFTDGGAAGGAGPVEGVLADGVLLRAPYRFVVVGDSGTLASALGIPGGVVDSIARLGGRATVERSGEVAVAAVRPPARPRYASPVPG